jgi:hypothetical protein
MPIECGRRHPGREFAHGEPSASVAALLRPIPIRGPARHRNTTFKPLREALAGYRHRTVGAQCDSARPGIDPAAVPILFAVNRPLLSTKLKRLPLRGMLGNGLRVVMGAVAAFGGAIAVTTRGHRLDLAVDRVTGKTNVTSDTSVPDMLGTTVEIMLRQFGGEELRPAELSLKVAREGKQYSGPSRPSWYNTDDFGELLARVTPHTATVARVVRDVFAIDIDDPRLATKLSPGEVTELYGDLRRVADDRRPEAIGHIGNSAYGRQVIERRRSGRRRSPLTRR